MGDTALQGEERTHLLPISNKSIYVKIKNVNGNKKKTDIIGQLSHFDPHSSFRAILTSTSVNGGINSTGDMIDFLLVPSLLFINYCVFHNI